ncbi:MAG: hypothetical protein SOR72_04395 [Hornefia sp.]|nr:hypothetical protein [Hornefia sp.]
MERGKLKLIVGILLIVIAIVFGGLYAKSYFEKKDNVKNVTQEKENQTSKKEKDIEKQIQSKDTIKSIDTSVKYEINDEIKNRIDLKEFDKHFKKYLDYNYLFTENTKATCTDQVLTIDYKKHFISFDLELNDKHHTRIVCSIEDNGNYSFDHM